MGFFEGLPPPIEPDEPPQPPRPIWEKPEDVLGGVIAQHLLLARNAKAAVAVSGISAFPTGFEFALTILLREDDRHGRLWHHGFHLIGSPDRLPDEFLRFGLRFADGTATTNLARHHPRPSDTDPAGPLLLSSGGGGGGRRYSQRYWVWPLPPEGPISFFCEWPAMDIAETRSDLDARLILDAVPQAFSLWPE